MFFCILLLFDGLKYSSESVFDDEIEDDGETLSSDYDAGPDFRSSSSYSSLQNRNGSELDPFLFSMVKPNRTYDAVSGTFQESDEATAEAYGKESIWQWFQPPSRDAALLLSKQNLKRKQNLARKSLLRPAEQDQAVAQSDSLETGVVSTRNESDPWNRRYRQVSRLKYSHITDNSHNIVSENETGSDPLLEEVPPHHPMSAFIGDFILVKSLFLIFSWAICIAVWVFKFPFVCNINFSTSSEIAFSRNMLAVLEAVLVVVTVLWVVFILQVLDLNLPRMNTY